VFDYLPAVGSAARFNRVQNGNYRFARLLKGSRAMPKLRHSIPKYRHHKASGQAVVTLAGIDHYLGPWRSQVSKVEYDRLTGEWLAAGRRLPQSLDEQQSLTVAEVIVRYWAFAEQRYRKHGEPTKELDNIRYALRPLPNPRRLTVTVIDMTREKLIWSRNMSHLLSIDQRTLERRFKDGLEWVKIGRKVYTTMEALDRFTRQQNSKSTARKKRGR